MSLIAPISSKLPNWQSLKSRKISCKKNLIGSIYHSLIRLSPVCYATNKALVYIITWLLPRWLITLKSSIFKPRIIKNRQVSSYKRFQPTINPWNNQKLSLPLGSFSSNWHQNKYNSIRQLHGSAGGRKLGGVVMTETGQKGKFPVGKAPKQFESVKSTRKTWNSEVGALFAAPIRRPLCR